MTTLEAAFRQSCDLAERLRASHERLTDTVRRLQSELGEKNRLLARRDRLAALGEMAAGLAHEIRNPLGGMQLYADLLAGDLGDRPEQRRLVGRLASGVKRLEGLVGQFLQFAAEITPQPRIVCLRSIVEEATELARACRPHATAVAVRLCGPRTCPVRVDPTMFSQIVSNLLLNALDAAAGTQGASVTVAFGPGDPAASDATGAAAWLSVSDEGPGVPADIADRLFDPFFTTKGEGTGLGLSIVHRLIEAHGGRITLRANSPRGATFDVRWPTAEVGEPRRLLDDAEPHSRGDA